MTGDQYTMDEQTDLPIKIKQEPIDDFTEFVTSNSDDKDQLVRIQVQLEQIHDEEEENQDSWENLVQVQIEEEIVGGGSNSEEIGHKNNSNKLQNAMENRTQSSTVVRPNIKYPTNYSRIGPNNWSKNLQNATGKCAESCMATTVRPNIKYPTCSRIRPNPNNSNKHLQNATGKCAESSISVRPNDKNFNCPKCSRFFKTKANLDRHECHICEFCDQLFLTGGHLLIHQTSQNCNGKKSHNPPSFHKSRSRPHITSEAGKEGDSNCYNKCNLCPKSFKLYSSLTRHSKIVHSKTINWNCQFCSNKEFTHRSDLNRHLRNIHGSEKTSSFPCKSCPKVFSTVGNLQTHVFKVHDRKFATCMKCDKCLKVFRSEYGLNGHTCAICEQCGKLFTTLSDLRRHELVHLGSKPFECIDCGRSYSQMNHLKIHLKSQCGKLPNFLCPQCGKGYSEERTLNDHIHTCHEGEVFNCEKCEKQFKHRNSLAKHVRKIHNGTTMNAEKSEMEM